MRAIRAASAALSIAALLIARTGGATPTIDIIVDDQDGAPGFTTTGDDWTTWGTLGLGYDAADTSFHYLSHTVGGSDRRGTATWTPDLPCAGTYEIGVWFRMTENRTHDADHFVHDGNGDSHHTVIDQNGDGASGWISLGEHSCSAGPGGCTVVLDGTDDDYSDAANAARFRLLECEGDPDGSVPACSETPEPGVHTVVRYAGKAWTSGDWENPGAAAGPEDGQAARSPNLDAGENLFGSDWGFCNPPGDETILKVQVESLGKTQYDSGSYDVLVELSAGGVSSTTWHHTDYAWDAVDITADSDEWWWFDVNYLRAQVSLGSHPGGASDSDVWVDAFRVKVTYESHGSGSGGAAGWSAAGGSAGAAGWTASGGTAGAAGSSQAGSGGSSGAPSHQGGSAPGGSAGSAVTDAGVSGADATNDGGGCACGAAGRAQAFPAALFAIALLAGLGRRARQRSA